MAPSASALDPCPLICQGDEAEGFDPTGRNSIAMGDRRGTPIGHGDEGVHNARQLTLIHRDERWRGAIAASDGVEPNNRQVSLRHENEGVPAVERAIDRANERARRALMDLGREIHGARLAHGLSQASVARSVGIAQSHVSEIERGRHLAVPLDLLARVGACVGLDISLRAFPGGQPLRDRAHIQLLERFGRVVGPMWRWSSEVPLPNPGDNRAWDRVLRADDVVIGVEGETRPTDMQELQRRLALKKRDGGVDRLILVLPNSEWCRRVVRLNDIALAFPVPGKIALKALAEGRDPGGDAIVLI